MRLNYPKIGNINRKTAMIYLSVFFFNVIFIPPFLWQFISSIAVPSELLTRPPHFIPRAVSWEGYEYILTRPLSSSLFIQSLINSIIISSSSVVLTITLASFLAYALVRMEFRAKRAVLPLILFVMNIPSLTLLIPLYVLILQLHLVDTYLALILLSSAGSLPFNTWLLHGYFKSYPWDLEEAALVDGCTRPQALVKVVLPLVKPALFSAIIMVFISSWNMFLYPLLFTRTQTKTLTVSVVELTQPPRGMPRWDVVSAATMLTMLPPILVALFFSRYLVRGLTAGAVKG